MKKMTSLMLALLLVVPATAAFAGHHENDAAAADGYLGSFQRDFDGSTTKLLQLADAFSAEHYGWRPTVEVRSVSEVLMHVTMANYWLSSKIGVPMPEEVQALGFEAEKKVTSKEDVMKMLKSSIEQVHKAVAHAADADLEEEIELFGNKMPKRDAFLALSAHSHEHLGQMIAYVRTAGLVPPWSQKSDDE